MTINIAQLPYRPILLIQPSFPVTSELEASPHLQTCSFLQPWHTLAFCLGRVSFAYLHLNPCLMLFQSISGINPQRKPLLAESELLWIAIVGLPGQEEMDATTPSPSRDAAQLPAQPCTQRVDRPYAHSTARPRSKPNNILNLFSILSISPSLHLPLQRHFLWPDFF